jgi:hypothetical protein
MPVHQKLHSIHREDFFSKQGVLMYFKSDGCKKQYKGANAITMGLWLSKKFAIPIDLMITCAHHGKCLVDALAGVDKHDLAG